MLESIEGSGAALRLGLKDRALQRRDQKASELVAFGSPRQLANLHRSFQAIRNRLTHLFVYFNQPFPDYFAVVGCFGAEIADQTSILQADLIEIFDLCIDVGPQAFERWKRVITKSRIDRRAGVVEIKIKYFEAESFFRNEVIGERPLRHSRSLDDVADASAREPAPMHDAESFGQNLLPV